MNLFEKTLSETGAAKKVTHQGMTKTFPVFRIPLDYLVYNKKNGRIATYVSQFIDEGNEVPTNNNEEFNKIIEYRTQAAKFYIQNEKNISDKSFSRASASSYFIFEKSSLKDTIDYLDRNGYEYKIRPDIQEAPGENFLVRISDHNPRAYIITKDKTETVWDYTDASILVTFQKIGNRSVTTNQLNKKLKILQTKDIWQITKFVVQYF